MASARKTRRRKRGSGVDDIPVASFSDIAFLLIIFFIIVTTLVTTEGFEAELPSGEQAEQKEEENTTIAIKDNRIFFQDEPVDIFELRARLIDMNLFEKEGSDRIVMLEEAGQVSWQFHVEVMNEITKAGGVVTKVLDAEEGG